MLSYIATGTEILAVIMGVFEFLPSAWQESVELWLRTRLCIRRYLTTAAWYSLSLGLLWLLLRYSGYVLGVVTIVGLIAGILLLDFISLVLMAKGNPAGCFLGLGLPFTVLLGLFALISPFIPFERLYPVFLPMQKISDLASHVPLLNAIVPSISIDRFQSAYISVVESTPKFIFPLNLLPTCSQLLSFLGLLCVEMLFLYAIWRLLEITASSVLFPLFQLAVLLRTITGGKSRARVPIIAFMLALISLLLRRMAGG